MSANTAVSSQISLSFLQNINNNFPTSFLFGGVYSRFYPQSCGMHYINRHSRLCYISPKKTLFRGYLVLTQIQTGNSLVCSEWLLKFYLRSFSLTGLLEIFLVSVRFMGHTDICVEITQIILVFSFCLPPFHYFYPHFSVAVVSESLSSWTIRCFLFYF